MKTDKLERMFKGWLVGNFSPVVHKTDAVEVAVKEYVKGDRENVHYHKIATEITVVVRGKVLMNGKEYIKGDIIVIEPNESTDFHVLEDAVTTVVKIPGARNDKYLVE